MIPVTNKKCHFCDNFADAMFGDECNAVPACMKCIDEKLDENLDRIDRERSEKVIKAINVLANLR